MYFEVKFNLPSLLVSISFIPLLKFLCLRNVFISPAVLLYQGNSRYWLYT